MTAYTKNTSSDIGIQTYASTLSRMKLVLTSEGIADAELDAWYLYSYVTGMTRSTFFLKNNEEIPVGQYTECMRLSGIRASHVPLQYITGTQEFMGIEFYVTPDVLIPRQDTELLAELAGQYVKTSGRPMRVLDLCTGSGCIIISLKKLYGISEGVGSDVSAAALDIARGNAVSNGAAVEFIQSDLFENITGCFDMITSNPPYIPTADLETLMPEVNKHEPVLALDGADDGLAFYRRIIVEAGAHLTEGGRLFFEIGYNQSEEVEKLLAMQGYSDIETYKDYAGLDRVVTARYK